MSVTNAQVMQALGYVHGGPEDHFKWRSAGGGMMFMETPDFRHSLDLAHRMLLPWLAERGLAVNVHFFTDGRVCVEVNAVSHVTCRRLPGQAGDSFPEVLARMVVLVAADEG